MVASNESGVCDPQENRSEHDPRDDEQNSSQDHHGSRRRGGGDGPQVGGSGRRLCTEREPRQRANAEDRERERSAYGSQRAHEPDRLAVIGDVEAGIDGAARHRYGDETDGEPQPEDDELQ